MKSLESVIGLALACILLTLPLPAAAQSDDEDEGTIETNAKQCINVSRIRSTKIIDDGNVIFRVRGREYYHSRLPRACIGLKSAGSFAYARTGGHLCSHDSINILYPAAVGFEQGRSCRLGEFYRVTRDDIDALENPPDRPMDPPPLPPAEPEVVIEDPVPEDPR